jgi:hypothetical protein
MKHKDINLWLVLLCLMLVQLACWPAEVAVDIIYNSDPVGYCVTWPEDERCGKDYVEREFIDVGLYHSDPEAFCEKYPSECVTPAELDPDNPPDSKPTLETSEIQPVTTPVLTSGACAWVLTADSDGYPAGEVKEGMSVGEGDTPTSLRTYFSHGKSDCGEQVFETYHAWYLDEVYHPGETVTFSVVFAWNNVGTADCASLAMAGGSTALSVGGLQIKAQNSSINIRTDPQGELSDSDTWVVPEGAAGDTLTITQNVSTGIYGKNIRWRYEYVCD